MTTWMCNIYVSSGFRLGRGLHGGFILRSEVLIGRRSIRYRCKMANLYSRTAAFVQGQTGGCHCKVSCQSRLVDWYVSKGEKGWLNIAQLFWLL